MSIYQPIVKYSKVNMKFIMFLTLLLPVCLALPNFDPPARIIGGHAATEGQFKHQVSLQLNNRHYCGGSVLSATKILTAAHCFLNPTPYTVVAGVTDFSQETGQRVLESRRVIHPNYDTKTNQNDIAIIHLKSPLKFNDYVKPITLRSSPVRAGERLVLSGWGYTGYVENKPTNLPTELQYITLQAISLSSCERLFGKTKITKAQVCTRLPPGRGACMGDSGGPLIDSSGQQVGIVSWGVPCAKGYPDVFTSIAHYTSWITNH